MNASQRNNSVTADDGAPPTPRLKRPRYFPPITRLPRLDQWPASHQAAWAKACVTAGPLDPPGRLVHLQPSSRDEVRKAWARLLSFLAVAGELVPSDKPPQCLTQARLTRYIASLKQRLSPFSVRLNIRSLYTAISAMAPELDWNWVRHHRMLPREAEVQMARKRIVPPDPVALLMGALDYCDEIDRLSIGRADHNAAQFRDGLMVALGTYFALRHKNLAETLIGRHLLLCDDRARLVFDDSIKNGEQIDSLIPERLNPYIERYMTHYRKILLGHHPDVSALWINVYGKPLGYGGVYLVFQRMGRRFIGRPISVHSVRYAAATKFLDENSHDIEVASAMLAHRGTSSVARIYDKSAPARANRIWAGLLRRRPLRKD